MPLPFAQPLWLLAGLFVCLGAALFISINIARRKKELQHFASPHLLAGLTRNVSLSRRRMKNILLVLGLACLFAALARPQYGNRWVEVKHKGIDILIGVDVSKSMLVRDISPNRLERAKLAIRDFVGRLEGDRVGLLPFAGTGFLMCPLTTDYDAFNASLDALDVNTIPKGGTNIGAAIRDAETVLANEANHKILILVTDGEDLSDDALKAAEEAKKQKMTIFTLGVGTPEGELIPMPGEQDGHFTKDASGNFVTSKLDENSLTEISSLTGGLYVPLGSMGQGFDTIYQQKLAMIPKEEHAQRKRKIPIERFPWPLGVAVFLLSADFLLTGRKSKWALRLPFVKTAGRRKKQQTAALMLILLSVVWTAPVRASKGETLFRAGEYDQAIQFYQEALKKDPANPTLHFNLGDSLYRKNDLEQAVAEFNKALKTEDLELQAQSYYNRGNAQYFMGEATVQTDPDHTVKLWKESDESFQAVLKLEPDDQAATHNQQLVQKKLEILEEQQEQKKSGGQCDNPQNKDGDQDKEDDKEQQKQKDGDKQQQDQKDGEQQQDEKKPGQEGQKNEEDQQQQQSQQEEQDAQAGAADDQEQQEQEEKKDQKSVSPAEEKQDGDNDDASPQPIATAGEQQQDDEKEEDMKKQNMQRRMLGKMTREEAENLLNSLKGEQGELNFIPQGTGNLNDDKRDW